MPIDICHLANYTIGMIDNRNNIGKVIKHQRISIPMTLQELAAASGVSPSYLGRIEREQRFPSGRVLRRIAKPLGFDENELFILAGYLSPQLSGVAEKEPEYSSWRLDPYVARELSREPQHVQRSVIAILNLLKTLAKSAREGERETLEPQIAGKKG